MNNCLIWFQVLIKSSDNIIGVEISSAKAATASLLKLMHISYLFICLFLLWRLNIDDSLNKSGTRNLRRLFDGFAGATWYPHWSIFAYAVLGRFALLIKMIRKRNYIPYTQVALAVFIAAQCVFQLIFLVDFEYLRRLKIWWKVVSQIHQLSNLKLSTFFASEKNIGLEKETTAI